MLVKRNEDGTVSFIYKKTEWDLSPTGLEPTNPDIYNDNSWWLAALGTLTESEKGRALLVEAIFALDRNTAKRLSDKEVWG